MKRTVIFILVVIIAALSVMSVSAAPRAGYYDQIGNKYWCNSDSYGCWVTNEDGGKDYIMFWSESAAEAIMGKNSGAPIGAPVSGELFLAAPIAEVAEEEGGSSVKPAEPECSNEKACVDGKECKEGKCVEKTAAQTCAQTCTTEGYSCVNETCTKTACTTAEKDSLNCTEEQEPGFEENTCKCVSKSSQ